MYNVHTVYRVFKRKLMVHEYHIWNPIVQTHGKYYFVFNSSKCNHFKTYSLSSTILVSKYKSTQQMSPSFYSIECNTKALFWIDIPPCRVYWQPANLWIYQIPIYRLIFSACWDLQAIYLSTRWRHLVYT